MNTESAALSNSSPGPGPEATMETMSSSATRIVPRSCHACHSKKIRCDKKAPRSACTRASKPCVYPPAGPRVRRTKKAMMTDFASRLSSIERAIVKSGAGVTSATGSSIPNSTGGGHSTEAGHNTESSSTAVNSDRLSETPRDHLLVDKGSSSEYFNEVLVSRVIEEVRVTAIFDPPGSTLGPYVISSL